MHNSCVTVERANCRRVIAITFSLGSTYHSVSKMRINHTPGAQNPAAVPMGLAERGRATNQ